MIYLLPHLQTLQPNANKKESILYHLNASTVCPINITIQSCFSDLKSHMKIDVIHEQLACCITMNFLHTGIASRAFLQAYSYCILCVLEAQTEMLSIASAGIVIVSFACCYTNAALPPFSWDTLPVFYHSSNQSGDFSRDALGTIAKFSMVTIEKWQAYEVKGVDDEDAMVIAMRDVKKMNPNVAT